MSCGRKSLTGNRVKHILRCQSVRDYTYRSLKITNNSFLSDIMTDGMVNMAGQEEHSVSHVGDEHRTEASHIDLTIEEQTTSEKMKSIDVDLARTPRGEEPPPLNTTTNDNAVHPDADSGFIPLANRGYFRQLQAGGLPLSSACTDAATDTSSVSSPLHSAGASSSSLQSTEASGIPPSSADSRDLYSRLIRVQHGSNAYAGKTHSSQSSRSHLSNPPYPTGPRSRNQPEGPQYPDQSFAALHHQFYTPPYPHNRANSPFFNNSGSQKSGSPNRSQEYFHLSSPARTGGNTPVESPGLFSRKRAMEEEMESSQYKAPSLHPTHNAAPKESHLLKKDIDAMTGHKLINNYEILKELGKGTHGKVKLARVINMGSGLEDQKVAIKIVKRFKQRNRLGGQETQEDKVKKEIAVLKKARHPHVVSLIEVIDDPDYNKVYMVLEYVEEGEMKWRRKADKWVVQFERRRIQRELEAWKRGQTIDQATEDAEIEDFNAGTDWRKKEKAQILAVQKKQAFDNISSRKSSSATVFTDDEQPGDVINNWSLEHGGESEDETTLMRPPRQHSRLGLRALHGEFSQQGSEIDMHQTSTRPTEVLPPFRDPFNTGSDPTSPALSLLGTPVITPSLPENVENDKAFRRELKNIQRNDDFNNFTMEDEHFRHVPCLTITRARECFRDTVLGLEYLHAQGIIHRDIKPANLLWTKEHRVKISDFGVSYLGRKVYPTKDGNEAETERRDDDVELARTVGTPAFYAPELCDPDLFAEGIDNRRMIGPQMDIWALGVTLYCMVFARLPFAHHNQIALFEVIAKQELFIPLRRLKAIRLTKRTEHDPKDRPEDMLVYEYIGDELADLLKRLLHKDPTKRISIKEIKCHPWVVKGMTDPIAWLEETDPEKYFKEDKIQITDNDVSKAIAPLSFAERFKHFGQRVQSFVRGRDTSKRASSRTGKSVSNSSRSTGPDPSSRRASLRSDDLLSFFRAPKPEPPTGEHPLSKSQLASPVQDQRESYFSQTSGPAGTGMPTTQQRPSQPNRGVSTAESVKTIRAPRRLASRPEIFTHNPWAYDGASDADILPIQIDETPTSHPSSITHRFGGTSRVPVSGLVSKSSSMSMNSTKSTSSDRLSSKFEDPHTMPLVGTSVATATGRVESPLIQALPEPKSTTSTYRARPRAVTSPRPPMADSNERAHMEVIRQEARERIRSRPHSRSAATDLRPLSVDDDLFLERRRQKAREQQPGSFSTHGSASSRPSSASQQSVSLQHNLSATSSLDEVQTEAAFSDGSRDPSMPSVLSTSSITSANESADNLYQKRLEEMGKGQELSREALMSTGETMTPATAKNIINLMETAGSDDGTPFQGTTALPGKVPRAHEEEDDIGYNGDHDADEESDDEGIVFGGKHR